MLLLGTMLFLIISPWVLLNSKKDLHKTAVIHAGVRLLWASLICSIIYKCCRDQTNTINWILSWPIWKPVARLNYAVLLFHYPLINLNARLLKQNFYFSSFHMFQMALGNYLMALLLAIPITLFVEMPFSNMEADWRARKNLKVKSTWSLGFDKNNFFTVLIKFTSPSEFRLSVFFKSKLSTTEVRTRNPIGLELVARWILLSFPYKILIQQNGNQSKYLLSSGL